MNPISPPRTTKRSRVDTVVKRLRKLADQAGPGNKLPSYRALMEDLGVSQTTVGAALRKLAAEGVTEIRTGRGIFVAPTAATKPILLLCDSATFVHTSPFWEMLLEGLTRPFSDRPDQLVAEFTVPNLGPRDEIPMHKIVSSGLWPKLQGRQFAAVMAVCVDERLIWELERLGLPVVGFGCPSHHMIRLAVIEGCQLGVAELLRLGCKKIALYNAPHIAVREMFLGALAANGASECIVPPTMGFQVRGAQLGLRSRLVESGIQEAIRLFGPGSSAESRPDGIVSVDDMFTQGFIIGLSRYGLFPGRDVEVASHENIGSPVLSPWHENIVAMEFDVFAIAKVMTSGANSLASGQMPCRGGWEESLLLNQRQGPLRTLTIYPKVRRKQSV